MHLALALLLVAQPQPKAEPLQVREGEPIEIKSGIQVPDGHGEWHTWRVTTLEGTAQARGRWYAKHATYAIWAMAGRYEVEHMAVITDWTAKTQDSVTEYRVVVVSPRGPPVVVKPPPKDPEPDPTKPGKRLVVIVYESSTTPVPLTVHAARKQLEQLGHQVRVIDKDVQTGTGETPREVAKAIAAAGALPALVACSLDGSTVISTQPLPATTDAIVREATK